MDPRSFCIRIVLPCFVKKRLFFVVGGVLFLVVCIFGFLFLKNLASLESSNVLMPRIKHATVDLRPEDEDEDEEWQKRIETVGASTAYKEFLESHKNASPDKQHTGAHFFGGALYTAVGLSGIIICDQQFNFGCYHEFLGKAIQDKGLEIVSFLNDQCIDALNGNFIGCQHGIGHGVLGYTGYDAKGLREALMVCYKLRTQPVVGGCLGGVFMEYNMETMLGDEGRPRILDKTLGYHYPCNVLERQFQDACYYEQPQWWQALYADQWNNREKRDAMFQRMGRWCQEATGESLRQRCYKGIGNNAPPVVQWKSEGMIAVCKNMPNLDAEIECRAAAAGAFFDQDNSWGICKGLSEKEYERCVRIAQSPR